MNASSFVVLRETTRDSAVALRIRGTCMAPALEDGAMVMVQARKFYLPGDVIVFRTNAGDLAAHRMLGWRRAAVLTKGDRCESHDAPVALQSILGAVAGPVPLRDRARAIFAYVRIAVRRVSREFPG